MLNWAVSTRTTFVITGHTGLSLLLVLVMTHFLCDFSLQTDRMAREKCPGCDQTLPWGWWLLSHASIHGLGVTIFTGQPLLGLAETIVHSVIDRLKCAGVYGLGVDQMLHLTCKVLWVALLPRF